MNMMLSLLLSLLFVVVVWWRILQLSFVVLWQMMTSRPIEEAHLNEVADFLKALGKH